MKKLFGLPILALSAFALGSCSSSAVIALDSVEEEDLFTLANEQTTNTRENFAGEGIDTNLENDGNTNKPVDVNPLREENTSYCKASFVGGNSLLLYEKYFKKGATPYYEGETPTQVSSNEFYYFVFKSWDKEFTPIYEDTTYFAEFEIVANKYEVRFVDENDELLSIEEYSYYSMPKFKGTIPEKMGRAFVGWDKELSAVKGDITYKAVYKTTGGYYYNDVNGNARFKSLKNLFDEGYLAFNEKTHTIMAPNYKISSGDASKLNELGKGRLTFINNDELYQINRIESYTFKDSLISGIDLPSSLTSIGRYAFYNCDNLTSFTVPSTITSLENNVFEECSNLVNVSIDTDITKLEDAMFSGCNKLTDVYLPSSLTEIDAHVFDGCASLKEIELPENIHTLGYGVFANCTSLLNVTLPSALTSISESLFTGCTNLETVECGSKITSIGDHAFFDCHKLTSFGQAPLLPSTVEIPNAVNTIGNFAFCDTNNIKTIYLPLQINSLGRTVFYNDILETVNFAGTYLQWDTLKKTDNPEIFNCENVNFTYYSEEEDIDESGESYTLQFDLNNGSEPLVYDNYKLNQLIQYPENPTKEGYVFAGWSSVDRRVKGNMVIQAWYIDRQEGGYYYIDKNYMPQLISWETMTHEPDVSEDGMEEILKETDMIQLSSADKEGKTILCLRNSDVGIVHDKGGVMVISSHIENITWKAFKGFTRLTKLYYSPNITNLPGYITDETNLTFVELPERLTSIEMSAVSSGSLKEITIYPNITSMEKYAFYAYPYPETINFCGTKAQYDALLELAKADTYANYPFLTTGNVNILK